MLEGQQFRDLVADHGIGQQCVPLPYHLIYTFPPFHDPCCSQDSSVRQEMRQQDGTARIT